MDAILRQLETSAGIIYMGQDAFLQDENIALDAQPSLVTVSNAGIPAFLSTAIQPKAIRILLSPMKAAEVVGSEVKKGDWTLLTTIFPVIESTGEVSSYGDYSDNGVSGANANFPQRQSFHYQTTTEWGERQLAMAALAKLDWSNDLNIASILTLNKFQNRSYFLGIAGLDNYGLLNDPNLYAPIAPINEPAGSGYAGGIPWSGKDALGVLADIALLFTTLQTQSNGLITLETPMTLAMSPTSEATGLTKTNNFNVNVKDLIKKNYPNMKVETAVEYATASGQLLQLIVDELEGQRTAECAFTEKLRAHPVVVAMSSFKQKKSQGTWGTIIYRPFLIAQMLGV